MLYFFSAYGDFSYCLESLYLFTCSVSLLLCTGLTIKDLELTNNFAISVMTSHWNFLRLYLELKKN